MGIIEITAPYNYGDKGPFVDTENDLMHFGEYLNSHEGKTTQKQRAKGKVFILSRKGMQLLEVIQRRN